MALSEFNVLAAGRRAGKTSWIVGWLKSGKQVDAYPNWSRVMLVANQAMKHAYEGYLEGTNVPATAIQVYEQWQKIGQRGSYQNLEIMIDEAQMILQAGLFHKVVGCTITTSQPCLCEV